MSEDKIKGAQILPISMNLYVYCLNRPQDLIDIDGNSPSAGITAICESFLKVDNANISDDGNKCPLGKCKEVVNNNLLDFKDIVFGKVKEFYSENEQTIKNIGKVITTIALVGARGDIMLFKVEMAKEKKKVFLRTIFIILLFSVFLLLVLWLLVRDTVMIFIFFVAVAYIYLIYLCEFKIEVYEDFL